MRVRVQPGSLLGATLIACAGECVGGVRELARTMGIPKTTLYELITARRSPSAVTLVAVADYLELPARVVLEWHGTPADHSCEVITCPECGTNDALSVT